MNKQTKNIEQLQKQLKELQMQVDDLRKEIEAAPPEKKLFEGVDESSTMRMVSDAVCDFSDYDAEFCIRTYGDYEQQGFFLGSAHYSCPWEIIEDGEGAWVLKLKDTE